MNYKTFRNLLVFFILLFLTSCAVFLPTDHGAIVPATADQDSSLPSIRLNNCTFHLRTMGNPEKQAIIFMHGGAMDFKAFLSFTETFNNRSLLDDYFLIFYDQRGKGLSERFNNKEDLTFDIYQKDLEAIADHFSPNKSVIFIAHSYGGIITSNYINRLPERVAGAIFLEPGEFSSDYYPRSSMNLSHEWVNDLMWGQQIIGASTHEEADFNFAAMMLSDEINTSNKTVVKPPFWRVGAVAQHWLNTQEFDFTQNLHILEKPVLFVVGGRTEGLGVEFQMKNMSFFSEPYMEVVEGAGHSDLIWSKRDVVLPLIFNYLDSLGLGE